jgi:hypothetical protein
MGNPSGPREGSSERGVEFLQEVDEIGLRSAKPKSGLINTAHEPILKVRAPTVQRASQQQSLKR